MCSKWPKSNGSSVECMAKMGGVAHEPLDADIDLNKTCGIGSGLVFAKRNVQKGKKYRAIRLVPCAVGGTSLSEWSRTLCFTTS